MTALDEQLLEVPRVKLDQIRTHPSNPRRSAVADEEMVESIRRQGVLNPVMLSPATDGDGWILIDGHRRFDGAIKAGVSDVPANPRYDLVTEAQQVEVMAITGLQSELLTPVEEAAVYEQLTLLGFSAADIAASTGFAQSRVKARMKLNNLGEKVLDSLHDGQLTLGDAEAFLEFADDPAAVAELEEAAGTSNFKQQVYVLRGRRDRMAQRADHAAALTAAGGREVRDVPGRPGYVALLDDGTEIGPVSGMHMFDADLRDPAAHDGCLGFRVPEYDYADIHLVCLEPSKHKDAGGKPGPVDRDAAAAARSSQWEKEQQEREAERALRAAADRVRLDFLTSHFTALFPTKSHQPLAVAAEMMIPPALREETIDRSFFARAAGIEPDITGVGYYDALDDALGSYSAGLLAATATKKLAGFGAYLAAQVAPMFTPDERFLTERDEIVNALRLWDWITTAGHKLSDVEVGIRARLESKLLAVTSEEADGGDDA